MAQLGRTLHRLCMLLCPYALSDPLTADGETCQAVQSLADSFAAGDFLQGQSLSPESINNGHGDTCQAVKSPADSFAAGDFLQGQLLWGMGFNISVSRQSATPAKGRYNCCTDSMTNNSGQSSHFWNGGTL